MADNAPEQNPFAASLIDAAAVPNLSADALDRKTHIAHEASIMSMGFLYYLGAIAVGLMGMITLFAAFSNPTRYGGVIDMAIGFGLFYLALAAVQVWVGSGLRVLNSRVRIPATILAIIGLLAIPIGTLINAYFLWLLYSKKGRYIFTPEYRRVIDATPEIKYKTSMIVWIFLGLLLVLIAAGTMAAFLGA